MQDPSVCDKHGPKAEPAPGEYSCVPCFNERTSDRITRHLQAISYERQLQQPAPRRPRRRSAGKAR